MDAVNHNFQRGGGATAVQQEDELSSLLLLLRSNQKQTEVMMPTSSLTGGTTRAGGDKSAVPMIGLQLEQQNNQVVTVADEEGYTANEAVAERVVTVEELAKFFHLPLKEVARQFDVCTTLFKRVCRRLGINKWPYRQIRSLTNRLQTLEAASRGTTLTPGEKNKLHNQILEIRQSLSVLLQNSNVAAVDGTGTGLLQIGIAGTENATAGSVLEGTAGGSGVGAMEQNAGQATLEIASAVLASSGGGGLVGGRGEEDGDPVGGLYMSFPSHMPSAEVAAALAAAAATDSEAQLASSSSCNNQQRSTSGRKRRVGDLSTGGLRDDDRADYISSSSGHVSLPPVGATEVSYVLVNEPSSTVLRRLHFLPPVTLAPLQRKRLKSAKLLVPLIEPDICNFMRIDFLPDSVLSRQGGTGSSSPSELHPQGEQTMVIL